MNRALPEMLHHLQENFAGGDMTVLERQRARLKWQQQQQSQQSYLNETTHLNFLPNTQQLQALTNSGGMSTEFSSGMGKMSTVKNDGWPEFATYPDTAAGFVTTAGFTTTPVADYSISRTASCPPTVLNNMTAEENGRVPASGEKLPSSVGKESFKKRKADKAPNPKAIVTEENSREKKIKGDAQEAESKVTEQENNNNNRETSADTSKENSKVSEVQKPDYIHVRARRGQATDSHSLAERVRREKISERMKYLQDLVPGCNKITGKAGMLDEIINYVQSLQRQVEFLSMKLAAVNPRLDFNIDNFFAKEMFPACSSNFPTIGMLPELANPAFLQFNPVQQVAACCGMDMPINPPEMAAAVAAHRRTTSAPVTLPETFIDTASFHAHGSSSPWDVDLQTLYNSEFHQGRLPAFTSLPFPGSLEANNLKMEM